MPLSSVPLLVSTRNLHKLAEIRVILGTRFDVAGLEALASMPEVEETGSTFEENAELKALAASEQYDGWVIADDSGLEVRALGNAPGIHSARYAGLSASDARNNELLLRNLGSSKDRSARFRCVIVLARRGRKVGAFSGEVQGTIACEPQGANGFGYDPLFVPAGFDRTFAELSCEEKNRLSHRARALEQLRNWAGW